MLRGIGSRLSYANVAATLALFVALGGGAYAATTFVGSGGVIRGCVARNGSLSLVKPGKRCPRGKSTISWNQHGTPGVPGATGGPGPQGSKGDQGPIGETGAMGPGAKSVNFHVADGAAGGLEEVEGIVAHYDCNHSKPSSITWSLDVFSGPIFASGDKAEDGVLSSLQASSETVPAKGTEKVNLDVIASKGFKTFSRFDLGGFNGGAEGCNFWGVIIPGT